MKDIQKFWEERIIKAKAIREKWQEEFKVQLGRAYFEGKQNPGYPEHEWITINKIYSHLMAQLPSLYSIDPYFYVKLAKAYTPDPNLVPEMERKGQIRQAKLNNIKREVKLKEKARLCVQDAHFAYGVMKYRYSAKEIENPHAGEPILDEEGNELKDEATGETLVQPDTLPDSGKYVVSRIHPDRFLWDEDAGPLEDEWSWVAEELRMTREELKKDPRFKGADIDAIKGGEAETEDKKKGIFPKAFSTQKKDKKKDIIVLHEIYDLKKREWLIIAENGDKPLLKPRGLPPGVENHPYTILRFVLRDKSPYPIPPVSQGMESQREINLSRSRILTHRKRFNRKYTAIRAALADPEGDLSKLENGEDGTVIEVMAHGAIETIKDAPLDQQGYQELALLHNDLTEQLGSPDSARGIASADSATEAGILDSRASVKEGDKLSNVIDFVTEGARKMDQLIATHLTKEEAVRVVGPQGEFWQVITPDDYEKIEGEFEYTVNTGASQPRLPDVERAQWTAFMSQVVIPMPHVLTLPSFMKRMAELYHIEDEIALKELQELGQKIMSGMVPTPGNTGSQPSQDNPAAAIIGMATGGLGGNNNGGGSQI